MNDEIIITEGPEDPALNRRMTDYRRNAEWLAEHGVSFFEPFRGRYIAVSQGEVFVADDPWEAQRLAKARNPDDEPFLQHIALERYERIYAC